LRLSEDRFALDASGASGGAWQVPVIVLPAPGGGAAAARRVLVAAGSPTMIPDVLPGSVVNAGQTGYFRVLYQGSAFTALRDRFGSLTADDQIGILNDVAIFGNSGRASMADFLDLASRLPPDASPQVWIALTNRLSSYDWIYEGIATQAEFRTFARALLDPEFQRTGFDAKPGEPDNIAILRSTLLSSLGQFKEPAVVYEAQRRFSNYLRDPASLSGAGRKSVLTIVATDADQAIWEQLHLLARAASSPLEKQDYYSFLGYARDSDVAKRALDLALTDEIEVDLRPQIIRLVGYNHPEMAFDFTVAHWDLLSRFIEDPDRRSVFVVNLLDGASETPVLDRLGTFAAAHVSPSSYSNVRKVAAQVRYYANIRTAKLPEVDRWIAARGRATGP
jgi:aminopeptidase N